MEKIFENFEAQFHRLRLSGPVKPLQIRVLVIKGSDSARAAYVYNVEVAFGMRPIPLVGRIQFFVNKLVFIPVCPLYSFI